MASNSLQLSKPDGSRDVGHPIVVADHREPVALLRIHPLAAIEQHPSGQVAIIGRDHTAFAGYHDLVAIKAEASSHGMPAGTAVLIVGDIAMERGRDAEDDVSDMSPDSTGVDDGAAVYRAEDAADANRLLWFASWHTPCGMLQGIMISMPPLASAGAALGLG